MSAEAEKGIVYLDSSAIVKLVVAEPESVTLREYLRARHRRVSCALARVEVVRAVRPHGRKATARAKEVLGRLSLIRIDDALLETAGELDPGAPRSLEAIHLAAALALSEDLEGVVTYDVRMSRAAAALGLRISAPE